VLIFHLSVAQYGHVTKTNDERIDVFIFTLHTVITLLLILMDGHTLYLSCRSTAMYIAMRTFFTVRYLASCKHHAYIVQ